MLLFFFSCLLGFSAKVLAVCNDLIGCVYFGYYNYEFCHVLCMIQIVIKITFSAWLANSYHVSYVN